MRAMPQPPATPDPLIDEVREWRQRVFAACGNDLRVLLRRMHKLQAQHPELVIDHRRMRAEQGRRE
jgi:hypothetical protein